MKEPKYLAFTTAGVVVFLALSFYIRKLPATMIPMENAVILQGIFSSICASFIFLLTLDGGIFLRDIFLRRSFRAFFGELAGSKTAFLVYPDFLLSEKCHTLLKDVPPSQWYSKSGANQYPGTHFINVPQIVASNDLLGLVMIANSLGKYMRGKKLPRPITDSQAVSDHEKSFVSFGLTSNFVTKLYENTHGKNRLFHVEDSDRNPKIVVCHKSSPKTYGPTDKSMDYQYGIVLRYRPDPDRKPDRFWFICAGLSAAGTPAASWNLATRWEEYHERFGKKDFVIVFQTSNDIGAYHNFTEVDVNTN